jgi:hypothetical protein
LWEVGDLGTFAYEIGKCNHSCGEQIGQHDFSFAQAPIPSQNSSDDSQAWSSASHFLLTQHASSSIRGLLLHIQFTSAIEHRPKLPMQGWEQAGSPTICETALMANSAAKKAMRICMINVVVRP